MHNLRAETSSRSQHQTQGHHESLQHLLVRKVDKRKAEDVRVPHLDVARAQAKGSDHTISL